MYVIQVYIYVCLHKHIYFYISISGYIQNHEFTEIPPIPIQLVQSVFFFFFTFHIYSYYLCQWETWFPLLLIWLLTHDLSFHIQSPLVFSPHSMDTLLTLNWMLLCPVLSTSCTIPLEYPKELACLSVGSGNNLLWWETLRPRPSLSFWWSSCGYPPSSSGIHSVHPHQPSPWPFSVLGS